MSERRAFALVIKLIKPCRCIVCPKVDFLHQFRLYAMKTIRVNTLLAIMIVALSVSTLQAQHRRGWSPQAKGSAIGAGIGGVAGAIINKRNPVVGGLIGVAAGAAGGYAIGKGVDNRRKTNARIAAAERETALARREAADARREAALARQEAAAVASRPNRAGRAVPAHAPAAVPRPAESHAAAPMLVTTDPVTNQGKAIAATTATLPALYVSNALFLPNTSYGNFNTAYPLSEVRRKSW